MDLDREIDRLMKRIEQKVAEPEIIFAAIKQLAGTYFANRAPEGLGAFNHFMDMSLHRRLSGAGLAVLTNDIKRRMALLQDQACEAAATASNRRADAKVHWL
ncbi:MAG: hypothetical protein QM647_13465 [Asticcacaulis sp.]|uniref:hypothetical protein n=1 Tax=Asticcacaulis sp. TaxID=1872648 RepID=UPI0039E55DC6